MLQCWLWIEWATNWRESAFPLRYSFPLSVVRNGDTTTSPSWKKKKKKKVSDRSVHNTHMYLKVNMHGMNATVRSMQTYHSNCEGKRGGVCGSIKNIDINVCRQSDVGSLLFDVDGRRLDCVCHHLEFHVGILLLQLWVISTHTHTNSMAPTHGTWSV